jgi:hypothetical protein
LELGDDFKGVWNDGKKFCRGKNKMARWLAISTTQVAIKSWPFRLWTENSRIWPYCTPELSTLDTVSFYSNYCAGLGYGYGDLGWGAYEYAPMLKWKVLVFWLLLSNRRLLSFWFILLWGTVGFSSIIYYNNAVISNRHDSWISDYNASSEFLKLKCPGVSPV